MTLARPRARTARAASRLAKSANVNDQRSGRLNPYQPPSSDSYHHDPGPLDAAKARLPSEFESSIGRAFRLVDLGLGLQALGRGIRHESAALWTLAGTALLIYGLMLFAKMRRQSPWWGVLGLLSCMGVVILALLPKKCHHCRATTSGQRCHRCGAPAPH